VTLITRKPWTTQPPGPVDLAPRWRDRAVSVIAASMATDRKLGALTLVGTPMARAAAARGIEWIGANAGLYYSSFETARITSVAGLCLVFVGRIQPSTAFSAALGENASSGGFCAIEYSATESSWIARFRGRAGGGLSVFRPDAAYSALRTISSGTFVARLLSNSAAECYVDGLGGTAQTSSPAGTDNPLWSRSSVGGLMRDTASYAPVGTNCSLFAAITGTTAEEAVALSRNPWQLFAPKRIIIPVGGAATSHATTGALTADDATIAGTATRLALHTTTGALSAQASTISGAAAHEHAATGALSSQAATIAGDADHAGAAGTHDTIGSPSAQDAAISGEATHLTLHTTTGALTAAAAAIDGTAAHLTLHEATGALQAGDASISGSASGPVTADTGATGGYWPEVWTKPIRKPKPEDETPQVALTPTELRQIVAATAPRQKRITLASIRERAQREAAQDIERVARARRRQLEEEDEMLMLMD
jgi:hypothetical protein